MATDQNHFSLIKYCCQTRTKIRIQNLYDH